MARATVAGQGKAGHLSGVADQVLRHTSVYGVGTAIKLALSIVNAILLTYYLRPDEFGRLALLLVFASLLTVLYSLLLLTGTLSRAYGAAEEEADVDDPSPADSTVDRRELMGTGLLVMVGVGTVGTAISWASAAPLEDLLDLTGDSLQGSVTIAAASGALGAVWRLLTNVLRLERRPVAYILLQTLRPLLTIAAVVPLVADGGGVRGAITATALGTGVAVIVALVLLRHAYRPRVRARALPKIIRTSAGMVPVIAGYWLILNADLFILAKLVDDAEIGHYRLAGRLAAAVSFVSSAFFMAWLPLQRSVTLRAAERDRGRQAVRGMLCLYFVFVITGLLLSLTLLSDVMVRIAPASYAPAARLLPVIGFALLVQSVVILIYRMGKFRDRASFYRRLILGCGLVFVPICALVSSRLGAYGAAIAMILVLFVAAAWLLWRSQRGRTPIPFDGRRILASTLLAAGCFLVEKGAVVVFPGGVTVIGVIALLCYPLGLFALGIVPRAHLVPLRRLLSNLLPGRSRRETRESLAVLDPDARIALAHSLSVEKPDEAELRAAVGALRTLSGAGTLTPDDAELGAYAFSRLPFFEREALAERLLAQGVEVGTLAEMDNWVARLRKEGRRWREGG